MKLDPDLPDSPQPARRRFRARYAIAALVCAGVVAWLVVGGLLKSIVYLRPVSYAVEHRAQQGTRQFRMAGVVVPGSIRSKPGGGARFSVTEGGKSARVDLAGDPPDLFADCVPVVVEGRWSGTTFDGDRLLIKHGSQYSSKKHDVGATQHAAGCPADSAG